MGALTHAQRVEQCLSDLRALHGAEIIDAQYAGLPLTYSFDWYQAPNFCGPYALYGPGQFTKLYPDAIAPEVRDPSPVRFSSCYVRMTCLLLATFEMIRVANDLLQAVQIHRAHFILTLFRSLIDPVLSWCNQVRDRL